MKTWYPSFSLIRANKDPKNGSSCLEGPGMAEKGNAVARESSLEGQLEVTPLIILGSAVVIDDVPGITRHIDQSDSSCLPDNKDIDIIIQTINQ